MPRKPAAKPTPPKRPEPKLIEERESWWRRLLDLTGLEDTSNSLRTLIVNVVLLLILVMVIPLLAAQFSRDQILIQPISVPEALVATGLTPDVAANRLWDGLEAIKDQANSAKQSVNVIPEGQKVTFSVPDAGISLDSFIYYVRQFFNLHETVVNGEFRCADAACTPATITLRLRVYGKALKVIDLPPMRRDTETEYWLKASAEVMAILDPFTALSAEAQAHPTNAAAIARQLIVSHHPDAKWAHNILRNLRRKAGDAASATVEYQAALALDPNFPQALANMAGVNGEAGNYAEAVKYLDRLKAADPTGPLSAEIEGDLARVQNQPDAARDHYLEAFRRDPLRARYQTKAALMFFNLGRTDEALALAKDALSINPSDNDALSILSAYYASLGDFDTTERLYRDAAEYSPEDAAIQAFDADLLMIRKDYPAALARYDQAVLIEDGNAAFRLKRADALSALGRHQDALHELDLAATLDPANYEVDYKRGFILQLLQRNDEAVAAYQRYLANVSDGTEALMAKAAIGVLSKAAGP
jgi:tetratricopeptide (TPR) repeat protein